MSYEFTYVDIVFLPITAKKQTFVNYEGCLKRTETDGQTRRQRMFP